MRCSTEVIYSNSNRLSESFLILRATVNKRKVFFLSICDPVNKNLHPTGSSSFISPRCFSFFFSLINIHVPLHVCVWKKKKSLFIFLLSVFQILNVTDGGLHIVPWFVVEGELGGVVVGAVTEGPVRSAVGKRTRFAVRRQPVHLFFFIQEREFHFDFNCTTHTRRTSEKYLCMHDSQPTHTAGSHMAVKRGCETFKYKSVKVLFTECHQSPVDCTINPEYLCSVFCFSLLPFSVALED